MELCGINAVSAQIVLDRGRRAGIQICSDGALYAEHQGQNSENSASCPHIQHYRFRRQILADLSDAELSGLMHACSESSPGIDMEDQSRFLISDLRLLPGGDRQNIVDPELVEILFPVVDPVYVLGLLNGHRAVSDFGIGPELSQFLQDGSLHLFGRLRLIVHKDAAIFGLLQKETKYR